MAKWTRYLIGRSWTVRAAFLALAIVLGLAAALWVYPYITDRMLLAELASTNDTIRQKAMLRAEKAALTRPQTLRRLNQALEAAGDDLFLTLGVVLRNVGKFRTPDRPVEMYDRLRAIELARSTQADVREILTMEAVAAGRTNRYQKQALEVAADDPEPAVRSVAATLAAMLGDDATLEKLLDDKDAPVAAGAAIDAGAAGRAALIEPLRKVLRSREGQARGAAAWALARLAPKEHGDEVLSLLKTSQDQATRDCLMDAAACLGQARAGEPVLEAIEAARKDGKHPSATALLAAGKLKIAEAGPFIKDVLRMAAQGQPLYEEQVLAAIEAAGQLKLDVRAELNDICQRLWGPNWPLVLIAASRELGRQMEIFGAEITPAGDGATANDNDPGSLKRPGRDAPTRPATTTGPATQSATGPTTQPATSSTTKPTAQPAEELAPLQTLRLAAVYHERPATTQPDQVAPAEIATPVPSAAAAVALWLWEQSGRRGVLAASGRAKDAAAVPPSSDDDNAAGTPRLQEATTRPGQSIADMYVRNAAAAGVTIAGEYIAWHLGTSRVAGAFELGLAMLPSLQAPREQRVYNDNERSAGAMLLALSARTPEEKRLAVERIRERLGGSETVAGEDSFFVAGSYRCALAVLGQAEAQEAALGLMEVTDFPQRRALTGLLAAGRKEALDWMLWNWQIPADQVDFLLVGKGLHEVVAATASELPRVDVAAPLHVRQLQVRAMRTTYVLNRDKLRVGLKR